MARPSDYIHRLVKSLTEQESSLYREIAATSNFGQAYLDFLNLIDSMVEYDEQTAQTFCRDTLKVPNFSRFKRQFFDSLLAHLELNRRSKNEHEEIDRQIREVDVLINKGLLDVAGKHIVTIKNRATRISYHHGKIEILNREIRILQSRPGNKGDQKVVALNEELDLYLKDYQTSNRYRTLYHLMFMLSRTTYNGEITVANMAEINKIMQHPLLRAGAEWPDVRSHRLYHSIHAKYARITGRNDMELQHQRRIVELWEQDREQIEANPSGYIKSLSILAGLFRVHKSYTRADFQSMLFDLESIVVHTYRDETEQFAAVALLRLMDGLNGTPAEFERLLTEYLPDLLQEMRTRKAPLPQARELALYFNIAVAYFVHGDFSKAVEITSLIGNFEKTVSRQDLQIFASILTNILMFEMYGDTTADTFTHSNERKLRKSSLSLILESICIQHLKKLRTTLPGEEISQVFIPWRDDLLSLLNNNNRGQKLGIEEIICWLNARISGNSIYAEYRNYIDRSAISTLQ